MIDLSTEHLVSLQHAPRLFPDRRRGRKPHVSCLYRWTKSGCRGVVLESVQVGATRCTSVEAIHRFIERLSTQVTCLSPGLHTDRSKEAEGIERELDKEGF